jgi:hypothetical protein
MRAFLLGTVASSVLGLVTPVGAGAHRFWRLSILATADGTVAANTFGLYEGTAPYTTNLVTDAAKLSSNITPNTDQYGTNSLVDGVTTTNWYTSAIDPFNCWIAYDFGPGNEKEITAFSWGIPNFTTRGDRCPTIMALEYSDNGTLWTPSFTLGNPVVWSASQTFPHTKTFDVFGDVSRPIDDPMWKRYWRILFTRTFDNTSNRFAELTLATSAGGATLATDISRIYSDFLNVEQGIDGNPNTTTYTGVLLRLSRSRFYGYDFRADSNIREVGILPAQPPTDPKSIPKDFLVQWSSDGVIWNTAIAYVGVSSWVGYTTPRKFAVPVVSTYEGLRAGHELSYVLRGPRPASIAARRSLTHVLRAAAPSSLAARRSLTYALIKGV